MEIPKPKKKRRKKSVTTIADELFAKIVRSAGKCFKCGNTYNLQCAHIISRGYFGTRYDFDNALCLCSGHHVWYTHHPLEWEDFIDEKLGMERRKELKKRAYAYTNSGVRLDYSKLIAELSGQTILPIDNT